MTSIEQIKDILFNDTDKLVYILEELGCHKINPHFSSNELRCALPDGETCTSVSVLLDNAALPVRVFSRGEYEEYKIKDIFTLVQFIKRCNFYKSLEWLCYRLEVENDGGKQPAKTLGILSGIRRKIREQNRRNKVITHEILDKKILNKYKPVIVQEWVAEGLSPESQKKYGIRNDSINRRWLIPIYDENGNLLSLKGRTYAPNWKEMGIMKFLYYHKIGTNDILFGLNFNKESIKEHDEIILFEAEKTVIAADSYGYDWCSSLGTNGINKYLRKKILALQVSNCVIALDNDVCYRDVLKEARKLSKYMNVWIMFSRGQLKDKQSPTDAGKEIFEELYRNRVRVR